MKKEKNASAMKKIVAGKIHWWMLKLVGNRRRDGTVA